MRQAKAHGDLFTVQISFAFSMQLCGTLCRSDVTEEEGRMPPSFAGCSGGSGDLSSALGRRLRRTTHNANVAKRDLCHGGRGGEAVQSMKPMFVSLSFTASGLAEHKGARISCPCLQVARLSTVCTKQGAQLRSSSLTDVFRRWLISIPRVSRPFSLNYATERRLTGHTLRIRFVDCV